MDSNHDIGVYVHFPYCERKCPYCDFNSHVAKIIDHSAFTNAYESDLLYFLTKLDCTTNLVSIFFGGGTPSLMEPLHVAQIIDFIKKKFTMSGHTIASDIEITLEANPSSFEVLKFKEFHQSGINRVSIGVQSFIDVDLIKLGRLHDANSAIKALYSAREIFERVSFDLIYARTEQNVADWRQELTQALEKFNPTHISLYSLTIEKGTEFYKLFIDGVLTIPNNQEDFYCVTNEICDSFGLTRYEVSNYAQNGFECKHNILYWTGKSYIGIGPGAHGRVNTAQGTFATLNYSMPEKYLQRISQNGHAIQYEKLVEQQSRAIEIISTGMRTKYGFKTKQVLEYMNKHNMDILIKENIIKKTEDKIIPTDIGISLCDSVVKFLLG